MKLPVSLTVSLFFQGRGCLNVISLSRDSVSTKEYHSTKDNSFQKTVWLFNCEVWMV